MRIRVASAEPPDRGRSRVGPPASMSRSVAGGWSLRLPAALTRLPSALPPQSLERRCDPDAYRQDEAGHEEGAARLLRVCAAGRRPARGREDQGAGGQGRGQEGQLTKEIRERGLRLLPGPLYS